MRPTLLLLAASVSGCAESQLSGSLLYMTPYKFEQLPCDELNTKAKAATRRVKEIEQLRDRAGTATAGPFVNSFVYGPDYNRARWEQRLYQDEADRKNCSAPPPEPPKEAPKAAPK